MTDEIDKRIEAEETVETNIAPPRSKEIPKNEFYCLSLLLLKIQLQQMFNYDQFGN